MKSGIGKFTVCILSINFFSPDIPREAEDVRSRSKFGLPPEHVLEILALFKDSLEIVIPSLRVQATQSDPEEYHIIDPAWAAGAESILSRDKHLLRLTE